ncbi:MAG: hypothetical protein HN921_11825 [Bacteroidetes bacterium]|nr:hypothetical protein [Bacteroidota bacterium]MBT5530584.1 hypothetical protein [Cytophagia bacterium]MBT3423478.1 hypothetical protein [Bacteroidota bacterium]MBT3935721.1 hypothetical protein [Bacteroidota bacterium]MBT4727486.1 hypothetical protein [Bacteroidota bacterium]
MKEIIPTKLLHIPILLRMRPKYGSAVFILKKCVFGFLM